MPAIRSMLVLVTVGVASVIAACASNRSSFGGDAGPAADDGGAATDSGKSTADGGAHGNDAASKSKHDSGTSAEPDAEPVLDPPPQTGPCGLELSGPTWADGCRQWMNTNCCTELTACNGNTDCRTFVDCINAAPSTNRDQHINACANGGVPAEIDAIATCSKRTPPTGGPIPNGCQWP